MAKFSVGQFIEMVPSMQSQMYPGFGDLIYDVVAVGTTTYTLEVVKIDTSWVNYYKQLTPNLNISVGYESSVSQSNIDPYYQVASYNTTTTTTSGISDWLPMPPNEGPPLPRKFNIYWPWYKGVALKKGDNQVTYSGVSQTMEKACASIITYITIVYRLNNNLWEHVSSATVINPGDVLNINVNQACTWEY
jgi:hypothetical protein